MTKRQDRASRMRQRLVQISVEMAEPLRLMARVREMLPGYVYHSRRRCGKPTCRCARGDLHEAWVVATKIGGKPTTRSLSKKDRGRVQRLTDSYRRFRRARRALRTLCKEAMELSRELEGLICEDFFKEEGKR